LRAAADQFDDARQLLQDQAPAQSGVLPLINNSSVAIELYLKSLSAVRTYTPVAGFAEMYHVTAEGTVKGHEPLKLFEGIPPDIRSRLLEAYAAQCPGEPLPDVLARYAGAFTASRYAFEKDQHIDRYPLPALMRLCGFLRQFVGALTPVHWTNA
jgi:hypothetical protein